MIYLFTALYAEAQCIIEHYQLKKDTTHTRFQLFENTESKIRLILTGVGNIAAACAVSSIFGEFSPGKEDFLVNIGSAAEISQDVPTRDHRLLAVDAAAMKEGIFLCSKITEQTTGRTFYPDVLYRHPFAEAEILTGAVPYRGDSVLAEEVRLYDMEAAAVYQAGAYFIGPHQMSFLKVVTDCGVMDQDAVTPEQIKEKMKEHQMNIFAYLDMLQEIARSAGEQEKAGAVQERCERETERLAMDLHCSKTMEASVRQHICYWILAGIDYRTVVDAMYEEGKIPCRDKREGKNCFDEIKRKLL